VFWEGKEEREEGRKYREKFRRKVVREESRGDEIK
jgi:hypothetical protein